MAVIAVMGIKELCMVLQSRDMQRGHLAEYYQLASLVMSMHCMSDTADTLREGLLEGSLEPLNGVACYGGRHLMPTVELHVCHRIALLLQVAGILQSIRSS